MKTKILISVILLSLSLTIQAQSWSELKKIHATSPKKVDYYGSSVSISGDWALVGAYFEDENEDDTFTVNDAGSAYFIKYENGEWKHKQKVVGEAYRSTIAWFGYSVDIDSNFAIIGANKEGLDENNKNQMTNPGAAYIFELKNGKWEKTQKLVPKDRDYDDMFGSSVAIKGNYAIIGANLKTDTSVKGNNTWVGAAYIFENKNGVWTEIEKIQAPDKDGSDQFGWAVDISENYAIVGAYRDEHDSAGGDSISGAGSAYIFKKSNSSWKFHQKVTADKRYMTDEFGCSVSINEQYALVGARSTDSMSGKSVFYSASGSAFFFQIKNDTWKRIQKVYHSDRVGSERFGFSVSLGEKYAVIGAGRSSFRSPRLIPLSGSAYIFELDSSKKWKESVKLAASDTSDYAYFGEAVAIDKNQVIVGATGANFYKNGVLDVNGSGAAYLFEGPFICRTYRTDITLAGCDSVQSPNGTYRYQTGTYKDSLKSYRGCDSIVTSEIIVYKSSLNTLKTSACDSLISPSGKHIWFVSGTYADTLQSKNGCDSILVFNLTVNKTKDTSFAIASCSPILSPSKNKTWSLSGIYLDTIAAVSGCDSILTINFTKLLPSSAQIMISSCSATPSPSGKFLMNENKSYQDTIPNFQGCDSVLTINFKLNRSYSNTTMVTCDTILSPSGKYKWFAKGIYTDTIVNHLGCDSILTITINPQGTGVNIIQDGAYLKSSVVADAYQWLNCLANNAVIKDSISSVFRPSINGLYTIEVKKGFCIDTAKCYSLTNVSIAKIALENLKVYPNPTSKSLMIDLKKGIGTQTYSIYSLQGQEILIGELENGTVNAINVSKLNGNYILIIRQGSLVYNQIISVVN